MQTERLRPVVGFIGLGNIGRPIAERLLQAGFELALYDLNPQASAPFSGRARIAESSAEVSSRADVVFGCLVTTAAYRDAILGPGGIVGGDRARLYIHIGTTGPRLVQELAAGLSERAIVTLDAAVTGGVAGAKRGALTSMVSGPRVAFDQIEPCFSAYSTKIVYLGPEPGMAQSMKLVNNMLSISTLAITAEVMVFGTKAGLSAETMLEVINNGTGQNNAAMTKIPNNIMSRSFDTGSALSSVLKDLEAYRLEADESGIESRICEAVIASYRRAAEQGSPADDISTVIRPIEIAAGVELKAGRTPRHLPDMPRIKK